MPPPRLEAENSCTQNCPNIRLLLWLIQNLQLEQRKLAILYHQTQGHLKAVAEYCQAYADELSALQVSGSEHRRIYIPPYPQRPDLLTAAGTFTQLGPPRPPGPTADAAQPSAPNAPGTPPASRRLESLVVPPAPRKTPESQRKHRANIFASRVTTRRTRNRLLTEVGEISTAFHSYLRELEDTLHQNIPYLGEDSLIQLWYKLGDEELPLSFISLYPHITCLHFLTRALNSNITGNPPETAPYIFVRLVHDRPSAADLYNHLHNIPHTEQISCSVWNVPRTPDATNHFNALTDFLHSNENADLPWRTTVLTFGFWDPYISVSSSLAPDLCG